MVLYGVMNIMVLSGVMNIMVLYGVMNIILSGVRDIINNGLI